MTTTANDITKKASNLKSFWSKRETRFKDWYKLIQMVDSLQQDKMESYVGNDPRAAYNMLQSVLNEPIPHRVNTEELDVTLLNEATALEKFYQVAWEDIYARYRLKGRTDYMADLIGLLLATGWYAVFAQVTPDGTRCMAEILHPAQVFSSWDDRMVECARIFNASPSELRRMAVGNKWSLSTEPTTSTTIYDYWWLDDNYKVFNAIVAGRDLVKPETSERFSRIPIFTAPTGGLPDIGLLAESADDWKGEIGQSFVAANENVYFYFNKWWTFMMQMVRDTAQPRWFEKSASGKPIMKPEDVFKRGAIFRGGPQDSIDPLQVQSIPVEVRGMQLDLEAQMQRGGVPFSMYGAVQQQLTSYAMSQVAASAHQMARPFHQAIINLITDIDNFWLEQLKAGGSKPYEFEYPKQLPEDIRIFANYDIQIPGDITARATAARMLNPNFRLSSRRIYDSLFPEIASPMKEMAIIRSEDAQAHPIHATVALIQAFKENAVILKDGGDTEGARLYEKAAKMIEASLELPPEQPQQAAPAQRITSVRPRPEVAPPEEGVV